VCGDEVHLIDYHSSNGENVEYYADIVMSKPYRYGLHWLPHDARAKTLASGGKSIIEQLSAIIGLGNMRIAPNLSLQDGIQASRVLLKRCWFDAEKTEFGVKCLREYQREYDDERKMLKDKPKHDFTSHGADAFRMLAVAWRKEEEPPKKLEEMRGIVIGKPSFTLNEMWATAKKMTSSRY
jgi:phage terminase large subunit